MPGAWRCSRSGVPSARLVVRRLGRGLGGSFRGRGLFLPLVSKRARAIHQRQRALGHRESSSLLCSADQGLVGSDFRGQLYRDSLSSESGRNAISTVEYHRTTDSAVVGDSPCATDSSVHHGSSQCSRGRFVLSQPSVGF